jgi:hypothetical protein
MNDIATSIQKRANMQGVSIAELCRRAGTSRVWFEHFKKRVPRSVLAYLKIEKALTDLENEVPVSG